uniref:Uncharacterized protein n=1 Tax=Setaria italica TaxID=4555 RepID=K3YCH2_SETIT
MNSGTWCRELLTTLSYDTAHAGARCSAFEALIATASRTRVAGFGADAVIHLCFAMSTRALLRGSLPRGGTGFYGSCYYIMRVSAPAWKVASSSVAKVVRLIKDGKRRMPAEFARWAAGRSACRAAHEPFPRRHQPTTCILVRPRAHHKPGGTWLLTQCITAEFHKAMLEMS